MRVLTIVGARPQFIKASMLSRSLSKFGISEILVHSGQHYDSRVSHVFFKQLGIPEPAINLEVGSGSHACQTGEIMVGLESFIKNIEPISCLIVYGDTNTTLAGALVASKINIPLVHIEAGLRSNNMMMPEEINRIATDKLSELLFCPTQTAISNLATEGIIRGVYLSGDVMLDATLHFVEIAKKKVFSTQDIYPDEEPYYLTTIHRASNTDNLSLLLSILDTLNGLEHPILFPLHPRTRAILSNVKLPDRIRVIQPVGYLQMLLLILKSKAVITDSGGLQKEAFWLKKPCITLREETEWQETLSGGWNKLVGTNAVQIKRSLQNLPGLEAPQLSFGTPPLGGSASDFIAQKILNHF